MGNIPIQTQQIGLGLGTVTQLPMNRTGGFAGQLIDKTAGVAEDFLTKLADQDAAIEGLNRLADFRAAHAKRLDELQRSVKTPEGFTPLALKDFDEMSKEFLGNIENRRVAQFLESRMPDVRVSVASNAVNWESQTRQALRGQNFSDSLNKYNTLVIGNIGAYSAARNDVISAIDAGGFEPAEAGKLRQDALSSLARSAVFGEIERNPGGMLKRLQAGDFADLDANVRVAAINAAQTEIRRQEAEAKAATQLAKQEKLFDVQLWAQADQASRENTGKGVPLPSGLTEQDLQALLKPQQYGRLVENQTRASMLFNATGNLKTQTAEEMDASVLKLRPIGGEADYDARLDAFNKALKASEAIKNLRKTDPVRAVNDAFPQVQAAWGKWAETQKPEDLQAAIKMAANAQMSLGIPLASQRALPVQMANSIAQNIKGAPPEKAHEAMQSWAKQFGPAWRSVLTQIGSGLPAAYRMAATIDGKTDAALLIQGSRQSLDSLRKAAGAPKGMAEDIATDDDVRELARALGPQGQQAVSDLVNSAEILALTNMATGGHEQSAAVESALKSLVRDKYAFGYHNSRPFVVAGNAYKSRVSEIEIGARNALATLALGKRFDVPPLDPRVGKDAQVQSFTNAVARNGWWQTMPGATGLMLMNELGTPVTVGGKPVTYTWDQLLNMPPPKAEPKKVSQGKGGPLEMLSADLLANDAGNNVKADDSMAISETDLLEAAKTAPNANAQPRELPSEDIRRQLIQKGRDGADWKDKNSVPRWLLDLDTARKQSAYGQRGIDPVSQSRINEIRAEYKAASEREKKQLKTLPVIKELHKMGLLD